MVRGERPGTVPHWAALLVGAVAVGVVGWTLYLTYALPAHHVTEHWRIAWAGFDLALAAALSGTAVGIVIGARWLEAVAAVATTLLLADAWFDVVLADPGGERLEAIVLAAVGEIPVAIVCLWVALNAQRAVRVLTQSE